MHHRSPAEASHFQSCKAGARDVPARSGNDSRKERLC